MNHIDTPIKMVLEARDGIGDMIEMFRINKYPIPSLENKGLPQLQAADFVAWNRLKKYQPSLPHELVKNSWKEINKAFCIDYPLFTLGDIFRNFGELAAQIPGTPFPLRDDNQTLITFNMNFRKPSRPFSEAVSEIRTAG